jgi:anaerobic magnesium-protoporphyrin IX monomethyl ester cyclase
LPGTKFYENVKSQLGAKQNWVDSDELAMMFQNAYPSAYYKILHRYIHVRYRMKKNFISTVDWLRRPLNSLPRPKKMLSLPYYFLVSQWLDARMKKFAQHGS